MPTPTRNDAVTALVFIGAAALGLVLFSGAVAIAQRFLGASDLDALVEGFFTALIIIGGGSYGAYAYNKKGVE